MTCEDDLAANSDIMKPLAIQVLKLKLRRMAMTRRRNPIKKLIVGWQKLMPGVKW